MSYDEFIANLRETPRKAWMLDKLGRIITRSEWFCPIEAVHPNHLFYLEAAKELDINRDLMDEIVSAADKSRDYKAAIRRDLLDACGLTEATA